jgi:hypothetical protein
MKIHDLNENIEIDEFLGLPALTKKGRMIQQGNKAVQNVLSDELRQMEVELAVWMKQSGIKQLTADDLQTYLDQKGLGDISRSVISDFPAKADAKAAKIKSKADAKAAKIKSKDDAKAAKIKSAIAAKQAALARGGINTPANAQSEPPALMASMYSENIDEAQGTSGLSRREVRYILNSVLQKAYRQSAGFSKSTFADKIKAKEKPATPGFKSSRARS